MNNSKGSLMFMSISDLFSKYLKNRQISNYEILVISAEIISNVERNTNNGTMYESAYKNIDFVPSLIPNSGCQEKLNGSGRNLFFQEYKNQLNRKAPILDLCAIVDMVVNEKVNVILICTDREMDMDFFEVMRDFIDECFSLYMISYKEFELDPDLLYNYGNDNEIRTMLNAELINQKAIDELTGTFINRFTSDMVETLRSTLMSRSVDELYKYGESKNIHVNRRRDKEEIVNHIIKRMLDK